MCRILDQVRDKGQVQWRVSSRELTKATQYVAWAGGLETVGGQAGDLSYAFGSATHMHGGNHAIFP